MTISLQKNPNTEHVIALSRVIFSLTKLTMVYYSKSIVSMFLFGGLITIRIALQPVLLQISWLDYG